MRVAELEILNFRGIRRLRLDGVHEEPLLVVSGANGAGKSLILEAIYLAATTSTFGLPSQESVGPWGPAAEVRLTVWLSGPERARLAELRAQHMPALEGEAPEFLDLGFELRATGVQQRGANPWDQLLLNTSVAAGLTFGQVDYLPADRLIPRGEQANISTDVLSEQRRQQLRQQAFQSATSRNMLSLSGIQPVLATLDYLDLIQERAGGGAGTDFEALTSAFERATGKRIPRPIPDPAGVSGARLVVETQAGVVHGLDQLSSGEQSVLGLMFYVRRLSSSGGVLLVDEPELHLHPALHSLLFSILGDVADRAQIWIVTHSTRLVTAASSRALVHVKPAGAQDADQAMRVRDDEARLLLLDDLGIDPAEALQADLLLIVEGESDRHLLSRLLPVETGRAQFVIGRSAEGVVATSRALADGYGGAWLAIRDRDLLGDEDRQALLEHDRNLFVWPQRTIENELLHPILVAKTFSSAGQPKTAAEAAELLDELFQRQRPQIQAGLVEARLRKEHALDVAGGPSVEQLTNYLTAIRDIAEAKLRRLRALADEVAAELDGAGRDKRLSLLDGKRALGELVPASPFANRSKLVDALVLNAHRNADARPPGLEMLRQRILSEAVLSRAPG